jgi:radical SAM superfamily enzyme YgiQ (UPF0313 family)
MSHSPYCGVGYIAEVLKRNKIKVQFMDLRFHNSIKKFFDMIRQMKPDLIGTTMFSRWYKYGYTFLEDLKSLFPEIKIVVGGPHACCFKEKMMEESWAIDYGITREGEDTIIDLCQGKPMETINGLFYRDNGEIRYNGDRPFITDLDRIPFPRYEEFILENYAAKSISISTSRGCFAHCTFCAVACSSGRRIRLRSARYVTEEIIYWYKKGYYIIGIVDDNFVVDRTRILELCEILRSNDLRNLQIKLDNGIRADCVDEEMLKAMFSAGVNKLSFGVESANDNILKNIKKGESLERIENAIRLAVNVGFQVHLSFIIGLPGETEKEVRNSFAFAKKMGVNNVQFYALTPYPETELFEWAKANNYLIYKPEEYLNFVAKDSKKAIALLETPELSAESRKALYKEAEDVARSIKRRKQWEVLEPVVGKFASKILIGIYTSKWFEKLYDHSPISFVLKRYLYKLRYLWRV